MDENGVILDYNEVILMLGGNTGWEEKQEGPYIVIMEPSDYHLGAILNQSMSEDAMR